MVEPDKDMGPIQQEERRRVFWSFFLCDKMISCGRERPPVINDNQCKLQLPADESMWRAGHYHQTPTLDKLADDNTDSVLNTLSPFAITIVVASLLGRCAQYALGEHEEVTPGGKTLPWNPRSKYSSIHSQLLQLESEVGLNEPLGPKIAHMCTLPDGSVDQHSAAPLVLAHTLFFLCQCLLYHPFLIKQRLARIGQKTPQSFLAQTFHSCRAAATALSRLMDDVKSLNCESLTPFYDPFYGYCTMVAGTIHSMFMSSSDPVAVDTATSSFKSSLQNLAELSYYWKSCGMMRSRLEDFSQSSDRYVTLVDPTIQDLNLSAEAATDLLECLDYSKMSATPRRKSQSQATNLATLSQLPSPFFEEFINLLPLSYSRPLSTMQLDDPYAQPPRGVLFDSNFLAPDPTGGVYSGGALPYHSTIPPNNINAHLQPTQPNVPVSGFSPASSHSHSGVSPSSARRGSQASFVHSNIMKPVDQGMPSMTTPQHHEQSQHQGPLLFAERPRSLTSPSSSMKRPWYEASVL